MKQGVLVPYRVRLLLSDGHSCYRIRRTGERKRKSVRGCIVGPDIAVLSVVIIKQGDKDIPGLTDVESVLPKRLGPKRATKVRRFFNLSKEDDVRKYVVRREVKSAKKENSRPYFKAYVLGSHPTIPPLLTCPQPQDPATGNARASPTSPPSVRTQEAPFPGPERAEGRVRRPFGQATCGTKREGRCRQSLAQKVVTFIFYIALSCSSPLLYVKRTPGVMRFSGTLYGIGLHP